MENFKKVLKDDDSLSSLKNMLEKLDEKDLEKFVVMFSKESKFFEDVKDLSIDELKATIQADVDRWKLFKREMKYGRTSSKS